MPSIQAAPVPAQAQKATPQSAHDFVQGFYDWYAGEAQKNNGNWVFALKHKRQLFSKEIVSALEADGAAQEKVPDEIVGIDFDPFFAAQDECWPYKVGKVTGVGDKYQAEVFSTKCTKPHPELPDVIAVVENRDAGWIFVNFIYPDSKDDLLDVLKGLKEERKKKPN